MVFREGVKETSLWEMIFYLFYFFPPTSEKSAANHISFVFSYGTQNLLGSTELTVGLSESSACE